MEREAKRAKKASKEAAVIRRSVTIEGRATKRRRESSVSSGISEAAALYEG